MSNLVLLVACVLIGVLLRRSGRLPESGPAALNAFIINVALPALILKHLHAVVLERVAERLGVRLDPAIAPPALHLESATPLAQFRAAIAAQWGFRPHAFGNAYAVERNAIYLIDEPGYYARLGRSPDESLGHELAHYVQVRYLGADLAVPLLGRRGGRGADLVQRNPPSATPGRAGRVGGLLLVPAAEYAVPHDADGPTHRVRAGGGGRSGLRNGGGAPVA